MRGHADCRRGRLTAAAPAGPLSPGPGIQDNPVTRYGRVRSALSTAVKWGISKLAALRDVFNGHAWMPPGLKLRITRRRHPRHSKPLTLADG